MASSGNNERSLKLSEDNIADFQKLEEDINHFKDELLTDLKRFNKTLRLLRKDLICVAKNLMIEDKSVSVLKLDQESSVNLPALFNLTCSVVSHIKEADNNPVVNEAQKSSMNALQTKTFQKIATNLGKYRSSLRRLTRNRLVFDMIIFPHDLEKREVGAIIDDNMMSSQRCSIKVMFDNIITSSPCMSNAAP